MNPQGQDTELQEESRGHHTQAISDIFKLPSAKVPSQFTFASEKHQPATQ